VPARLQGIHERNRELFLPLDKHRSINAAVETFFKTIKAELAIFEYICKIWTLEPDRFILNPIHQMPGLNT